MSRAYLHSPCTTECGLSSLVPVCKPKLGRRLRLCLRDQRAQGVQRVRRQMTLVGGFCH